MKAIIHDRYGPPEVLELREVERPGLDDDQILIRVQAASVNPLDWHFMRGEPAVMRLQSGLRTPKNRFRGVDVAGEVDTVGKSVTRFRPGDQVFGWCQGAFAEYARGKETNFVMRPPELTPEQAAAVPVAGFTALQGLRDKANLQAGQRALIIGASGGVGTFAVQIARSMGAEVTATCSTRNVELVRSLGANHVIDYTTQPLPVDRPYDVIFQLAGTESPGVLRRSLTPTGTLVLSSGMGRLTGIDRIVKGLVMSRFINQNMVTFIASENQEDLVALKELIESGQVTPIIDRTYPLAETPEAVRYVEAGHTRGKVIVTTEAAD